MNRKTKFAAIVALSIAGWAFAPEAAAQKSNEKSKQLKSEKLRLTEENREQLKKQQQKVDLRKELERGELLKEKVRQREETKKQLKRRAVLRSRKESIKDGRLEKASPIEKRVGRSKGK
jgi:hypothetical protein